MVDLVPLESGKRYFLRFETPTLMHNHPRRRASYTEHTEKSATKSRLLEAG